MSMTPTPPRKKIVIPAGSIIPQGEPDPELVAAAVAAVPELNRTPKVRPEMADSMAPGITEAPMPEPRQELKMPPPTPLPPARPADETVPAFGTVSRFKEGDLVELTWLRDRLGQHFPNVSPNQWPARLRMLAHENTYLFVRNARAVALARVQRDEFSDKPYVVPVFVVHADRDKLQADDQGGASDAAALVREIVRWAKTMGASEVRHLSDHADIPPGRLKEAITGAEYRQEVVVKIK